VKSHKTLFLYRLTPGYHQKKIMGILGSKRWLFFSYLSKGESKLFSRAWRPVDGVITLPSPQGVHTAL
jgi:hypothetical protein